MDIAIAVLMTLAVGAFIVWPLLGRIPPEAAGEVPLPPLERQKREAYAAIKEAEFDFQMGKLTEADYETLRARYTAQALDAIAGIDAQRDHPPEAMGSASRPPRMLYCAGCGVRVPPKAKFCASCGRAAVRSAPTALV